MDFQSPDFLYEFIFIAFFREHVNVAIDDHNGNPPSIVPIIGLSLIYSIPFRNRLNYVYKLILLP